MCNLRNETNYTIYILVEWVIKCLFVKTKQERCITVIIYKY